MAKRPDYVPVWMNWPNRRLPVGRPGLVFGWFCLAVPAVLALLIVALVSGSALYILPVHPDLFQAAAHAHSLYLEQLFSGGIIGLGLFVSSILLTMVLAFFYVRQQRER